jgi:hypothetical protein
MNGDVITGKAHYGVSMKALFVYNTQYSQTCPSGPLY